VATKIAKRLLASYPDFGKAPPAYGVTITEALAELTPEELGWITDRSSGLATVCKFLPSVGDIHEFLRCRRELRDRFKPAHTAYKMLAPDRSPEQLSAEQRRQIVLDKLGYNPNDRTSHPHRQPVDDSRPPPSQEYLDALIASHDVGVAETIARKGERHKPPTPSREI
jgi:hypothetical protein